MEINNKELPNNSFETLLLSNENDVSIPVIHESIVIDKNQIETNKIRVTKKVNEEEQIVNIPLIHDEIDIETIPINQYVDDYPQAIRYEGDTMIISVLKEVSVVRILLEKEIRVTRKKIETHFNETITLKKEEIIIENIALTDNNQLG